MALEIARDSVDLLVCQESATVQDDEAGADQLDLVQLVRGDEDGLALGRDRSHELAHLDHALGVEPVHGLVNDDKLGFTHECVSKREALLHAHRVSLEMTLGVGLKTDALKIAINLHFREAACQRALPKAVAAGHGRHESRTFNGGADEVKSLGASGHFA